MSLLWRFAAILATLVGQSLINICVVVRENLANLGLDESRFGLVGQVVLGCQWLIQGLAWHATLSISSDLRGMPPPLC